MEKVIFLIELAKKANDEGGKKNVKLNENNLKDYFPIFGTC